MLHEPSWPNFEKYILNTVLLPRTAHLYCSLNSIVSNSILDVKVIYVRLLQDSIYLEHLVRMARENFSIKTANFENAMKYFFFKWILDADLRFKEVIDLFIHTCDNFYANFNSGRLAQINSLIRKIRLLPSLNLLILPSKFYLIPEIMESVKPDVHLILLDLAILLGKARLAKAKRITEISEYIKSLDTKSPKELIY
jgi:hypothetical protein